MTDASQSVPTAACVCGSGLNSNLCCRPDTSLAPAPPAPDSEIQAIARALGGDAAAGERALLHQLSRTPLDLRALRLLQALRAREGKAAAAEALLARIVRLDPNDLEATLSLALALFNRGALAEAEPLAATPCASRRRTCSRTT